MNRDEKKQEMRSRTVSGRRDRVSQASGIRTACLAILPLTKAKKVVDEIYRLGRMADEVVRANDGYLFSTFDEAAKAELANGA